MLKKIIFLFLILLGLALGSRAFAINFSGGAGSGYDGDNSSNANKGGPVAYKLVFNSPIFSNSNYSAEGLPTSSDFYPGDPLNTEVYVEDIYSNKNTSTTNSYSGSINLNIFDSGNNAIGLYSCAAAGSTTGCSITPTSSIANFSAYYVEKVETGNSYSASATAVNNDLLSASAAGSTFVVHSPINIPTVPFLVQGVSNPSQGFTWTDCRESGVCANALPCGGVACTGYDYNFYYSLNSGSTWTLSNSSILATTAFASGNTATQSFQVPYSGSVESIELKIADTGGLNPDQASYVTITSPISLYLPKLIAPVIDSPTGTPSPFYSGTLFNANVVIDYLVGTTATSYASNGPTDSITLKLCDSLGLASNGTSCAGSDLTTYLSGTATINATNSYSFTVSGVSGTIPTVGSVYTNNGGTFTVLSTNLTTSGSSTTGSIICSTTGAPSSSGTLAGSGSTVTFTSNSPNYATAVFPNIAINNVGTFELCPIDNTINSSITQSGVYFVGQCTSLSLTSQFSTVTIPTAPYFFTVSGVSGIIPSAYTNNGNTFTVLSASLTTTFTISGVSGTIPSVGSVYTATNGSTFTVISTSLTTSGGVTTGSITSSATGAPNGSTLTGTGSTVTFGSAVTTGLISASGNGAPSGTGTLSASGSTATFTKVLPAVYVGGTSPTIQWYAANTGINTSLGYSVNGGSFTTFQNIPSPTCSKQSSGYPAGFQYLCSNSSWSVPDQISSNAVLEVCYNQGGSGTLTQCVQSAPFKISSQITPTSLPNGTLWAIGDASAPSKKLSWTYTGYTTSNGTKSLSNASRNFQLSYKTGQILGGTFVENLQTGATNNIILDPGVFQGTILVQNSAGTYDNTDPTLGTVASCSGGSCNLPWSALVSGNGCPANSTCNLTQSPPQNVVLDIIQDIASKASNSSNYVTHPYPPTTAQLIQLLLGYNANKIPVTITLTDTTSGASATFSLNINYYEVQWEVNTSQGGGINPLTISESSLYGWGCFYPYEPDSTLLAFVETQSEYPICYYPYFSAPTDTTTFQDPNTVFEDTSETNWNTANIANLTNTTANILTPPVMQKAAQGYVAYVSTNYNPTTPGTFYIDCWLEDTNTGLNVSNAATTAAKFSTSGVAGQPADPTGADACTVSIQNVEYNTNPVSTGNPSLYLDVNNDINNNTNEVSGEYSYNPNTGVFQIPWNISNVNTNGTYYAEVTVTKGGQAFYTNTTLNIIEPTVLNALSNGTVSTQNQNLGTVLGSISTGVGEEVNWLNTSGLTTTNINWQDVAVESNAHVNWQDVGGLGNTNALISNQNNTIIPDLNTNLPEQIARTTSRILNRPSSFPGNTTIRILYKVNAVNGQTPQPVISIYDPTNNQIVSSQSMTQVNNPNIYPNGTAENGALTTNNIWYFDINFNGAYPYSTTGDYTIICNDPVTTSSDSVIMTLLPGTSAVNWDQISNLATAAQLNTAVSTLVTSAELNTAVSTLPTTTQLNTAVSTLATSAQLNTAVSTLATSAQLSTAVSTLATSAQLNTEVSTLATSAQLSTAVSTLATSAQLNTAVSTLATSAQLSTAVSTLATSAQLNTAVSTLATSAQLSTAVSTLATSAQLNTAVSTLATSAQLNTAVSTLATSAQLNTAVSTLATSAQLNTAVSTLATSAQLSTAVSTLATSAQLNTAVSTLATSAQLSTAVSTLATSAQLNTAVSTLATSAQLSTAVSTLATSAQLNTAVSTLATSTQLSTAVSTLATSAQLSTAVSTLATSAQLSTAVSTLATSTQLSTAVSTLATSAQLSTAVSTLATSTQLNSAVSTLVTSTQLTSAFAQGVRAKILNHETTVAEGNTITIGFMSSYRTSGASPTITVYDAQNNILGGSSETNANYVYPSTQYQSLAMQAGPVDQAQNREVFTYQVVFPSLKTYSCTGGCLATCNSNGSCSDSSGSCTGSCASVGGGTCSPNPNASVACSTNGQYQQNVPIDGDYTIVCYDPLTNSTDSMTISVVQPSTSQNLASDLTNLTASLNGVSGVNWSSLNGLSGITNTVNGIKVDTGTLLNNLGTAQDQAGAGTIGGLVNNINTNMATSSGLSTAASSLATSAQLSAAVSTLATSAEVNNAVSSLATSGQLNSAISTLATSAEINNAVSSLATSGQLNGAISTLATSAEINNAVSSLATSGQLNSAISTLATSAEINNAVSSLATSGQLNGAISTLATSAEINNAVSSLATSGQLNSAISTLATSAEINNAVSSLATSGQLNSAISTLATSAEINNAVSSLATSGQLNGAISTLATSAEINNAVSSLATSGQLNGAISTLATSAEINNAVSSLATSGQLNGAISTLATSAEINNAVSSLATTTQLNRAVSTLATSSEISDAVSSLATTTQLSNAVSTLATSAELDTVASNLATSTELNQVVSSLVSSSELNSVVSTLASSSQVSQVHGSKILNMPTSISAGTPTVVSYQTASGLTGVNLPTIAVYNVNNVQIFSAVMTVALSGTVSGTSIYQASIPFATNSVNWPNGSYIIVCSEPNASRSDSTTINVGTVADLSSIANTLNSLTTTINNINNNMAGLQSIIGSTTDTSTSNTLLGKISGVTSNVSSVIQNWTTTSTTNITSAIASMESYLGTPTDSAQQLTVFGKIAQVSNQTGGDPATNAVANQIYTEIQDVSNEMTNNGKSDQALSMINQINTEITQLQQSVSAIHQNSDGKIKEIAATVNENRMLLKKVIDSAGFQGLIQGQSNPPATIGGLQNQVQELKGLIEKVKKSIEQDQAPVVKTWLEKTNQ